MAPLTRRRKKALAAAPPPPVINPADRISRLPEGVQAQILSSLPAQEVVRTSVLARAWRDVWKSTRRLLITGDSVQKVREFVDCLLINFASLDACEIRFNPCEEFDEDDYDNYTNAYLNEEDESIVNGWICRVLECQIQMLQIDMSADSGYIQGSMTVNNKALVSRHLTRLELKGIVLVCRCLNLDVCPALEYLEIDDCFFSNVWKIMSLSLKRLVITSCDSYSYPNLHRIRIFVPHLVSLLLDGDDNFMTPLLQRMPELVEAKVQISSRCDSCSCKDPMACYHVTGDIDSESDDEDKGSADCAGKNTSNCMVLEGLAQATDLVLTSSDYESTYIFRRDLRWCPTFSKLKTLVLNHDYWCQPADCSAVACILEHAPLLEKLTLTSYWGLSSKKYEVELKGHPVATLMSTKISQHLKIVEISCENVNERILNVLSFLHSTTTGIFLVAGKRVRRGHNATVNRGLTAAGARARCGKCHLPRRAAPRLIFISCSGQITAPAAANVY